MPKHKTEIGRNTMSPRFTPGPTIGGSNGGDQAIPTPTAHDLRIIAERADGLRNEEVTVIFVDGQWDVRRSSDPPRKGERAVFTVLTMDKDPHPDLRLILDVKGKAREIQSGYDAAFWSESAVEKFVLPYYQRFLSPKEMQKLQKEYVESDTVAILHTPPTRYETVIADPTGGFKVRDFGDLNRFLK